MLSKGHTLILITSNRLMMMKLLQRVIIILEYIKNLRLQSSPPDESIHFYIDDLIILLC